MKIERSFLLAAMVVLATAAGASAQATIQTTPNSVPRGSQSEREITDEDLIHSLFDPITNSLNLTPKQKFTIVSIAGASMNRTEPLFDQLDELDDQMSIVAFSGALNETRLKELSMRQAVVMAEINATIARAKANFYKVLTPEQRAMILAQYKSDQSLGAISNVGP
jgi:Spy/CpxP family protein refolding chaperone